MGNTLLGLRRHPTTWLFSLQWIMRDHSRAIILVALQIVQRERGQVHEDGVGLWISG